MKKKLELLAKKLCLLASIALIAVIGFSFAACSNGSTDSTATVYAAGYYYNGSYDVACYWKGTAKTDLHTTSSTANAISVAGSDVYVAGQYWNGSSLACYWKNGTKTDLSTGYSRANGIVVK